MEKQKNIPSLRFPEFEGEWEKKYLKDVLSNKSIKYNPEIHNEALKCIELEHLATGTGQLLGFTDSTESGSIKNRFKKGDVLFGKLRPYLRKYLLAPFDGVCSSEIWVINGRTVLNEYIYWLIQTEKFIGLANQSSGSKMPRADWDVIASSAFRFPTLHEQQKIASFFTTTDKKITQLKQKNTLLEQYKKAVMHKIFSQEIRFKGNYGHEFPKWEKKKLGDVLFEHKTFNTDNTYEEVFSVAKHKGVINQIEHLGRSFSAKDISNYKVIYPYDIVYTKSPTSDFPFGIIKQNLSGRIGVVSPLYGVFKPTTNALGFLLHNYFLSWINTYNYLNPLVQKGAKNTMNINNDDFLNGAKISLPVSAEEQVKIANFMSAIDDKITHTQKQIDKAEVWKKGLMQQMFV